MADLKWIKILTDIFDDEKMVLIDSFPERDPIIVIWFKILCLAGKQNNSGVLLLNDRIPFTDEMLATIFRRPLEVVRLALNVFEQFGMIEVINHVYTIPNWEKHQAQDKLEIYREKTRKRVAAHRERQKLLANGGAGNVTVTEGNDVEDNEYLESEITSDSDSDIEESDCQYVLDSYNEICVSLPKVQKLTESRKTAIRECLRMFSSNEVRSVFGQAEASPFLTGDNETAWKACFDWIIQPEKMVRIMEGTYDRSAKKQKEVIGKRELDEDDIAAIRRMMFDEK